MADINTLSRFRGCLLGLASGDAVGTAAEFKPRGTFPPVTDMTGGGPFNLNPGEWTDDTSMALCLATSLIEMETFDPKDQMTRYLRWSKEGYLSATGRCVDMGRTVAGALDRFERSGDPISGSAEPGSAGNGSLMRLAPVPMFYFPDESAARAHAAESSRTTHGAPECVDACRFFAGVLFRALSGADKDVVLLADAATFTGEPAIASIARGEYREKAAHKIRGTGYVVHCLEAALWSFHHADNFADAILLATNLGEDTDTTAAVCGQVAGAYYGESGIPILWLDRLTMRAEIARLAEALYHAGPATRRKNP